MQLTHTPKTRFQSATRSRAAFIKRFAKDEDGSIIIMSLLLLVSMLIIGGMAVDFMRFEAERAELQSVSDRAVLAAASLDQDLDSADVVIDYFEKAGWGGSIIGAPSVEDRGNSRKVFVRSEVDMDTFYLRLVGIDQLTAPAQSGAIEGIGKVEISMVLDISGSMRFGGSGGRTRFQLMQAAAKSFANKVLDPNNGGQVSLNIVPYAGQTNPGPVAFEYLRGVPYRDDRRVPGPDGRMNTADDEFFPNVSSCIEMETSDFNSSNLPPSGRDQVPHFMFWSIAASVMDWGWCPLDKTSIQYAFNDASDAATFIDNMRMHDGTGTHYGMKYGLALLDPDSQPLFEYLNTHSNDARDAAIEDAVANGVTDEDQLAVIGSAVPLLVPDQFVNRPAPWSDPETKKIIVLMTDGVITEQVRPTDATRPDNLTIALNDQYSSRRYELSRASTNVTSFSSLCNLAKAPSRDVTIYAIAFETDATAQGQMRTCASDASTYSSANGDKLIEVFNSIAEQITDLRLNL